MADYYPLIARAISGLDPSAPGEQRRALYERARTALIAQLRSVEPPLSESEITRERLSLEEAVRKVESEAAQRARDASRPATDAKPRAGDAFRNNGPRANAQPLEPSPRGRQPITPTVNPNPPAPPSPRERPAEEPRPRTLRVEPPPIPKQQSPNPTSQDPNGPPTRERNGTPRRFDNAPPATRNERNDRGERTDRNERSSDKSDAAMRGFRDVTADVDDLGRAAAQANRAARKTYANVPSPSPEFDRLEPSMENRSEIFGYEQPGYDALDDDDPPPALPSRIRDTKDKKQPKPPKPKRVRGGFPFKTAILIGIVMILVGAAILAGPSLLNTIRGLSSTSPAPAVSDNKDAAQAPRPKIADRVGQPSSSDQIAPVAQRVVLYDEDPAEPKGRQYVGTVVWRTEQIKAAGGKPDIAVRADIEIPDRKFKMTMSFRRNNDTTLPASHTAELTFVLPPDFAGGGVANVPGVLMKSNEQARGTPLAGLAVKVTDGFFLVGLSNVDSDRTRNLQLLKERSWFDIPLVYTNQRRAIIAIEKGSPGDRAFNDAFAAWGE
jgi:hypothetical protein